MHLALGSPKRKMLGFHAGFSTSRRIKERSVADPALVLARHRIGVQCRIGDSLDSAYFEYPDNLYTSALSNLGFWVAGKRGQTPKVRSTRRAVPAFGV